MIRFVINIILLGSCAMVWSQQLDVSISAPEIKIGEPFTITLSVKSEQQIDSINYKSHIDIFPAQTGSGKLSSNQESYDLEILIPFKDSSFVNNDNKFIWQGKYTVTGWDSAYVVILPEKITLGDSLFTFPPGLIEVVSPAVDPTQPIYDINEVFTEVKGGSSLMSFLRDYWWALLIFIGLIIALILFFKGKTKKQVIELSLRQATLLKIEQLENSKGYETNLKEYYYDLSIILRRFFASYYQAPIMDKTTPVIERILSQHGLNKEMVQLTRQLLTQSDMVKFAKSKPEISEILKVTENARRLVNEIADLDLNSKNE